MPASFKGLDVTVDQIIKSKQSNKFFVVMSISLLQPSGDVLVQCSPVEPSDFNHHGNPIAFSTTPFGSLTFSYPVSGIWVEFEPTKFRVNRDWAIAYLDDHGNRVIMPTSNFPKSEAIRLAKSIDGKLVGYITKV